MTAVQDFPRVQECTAEGCSYNAEHVCHAGAITVGGDHAHCGTFVQIGTRGGVPGTGQVGACHRDDCRHNEALECHAGGVRIGEAQDLADCLTYAPR